MDSSSKCKEILADTLLILSLDLIKLIAEYALEPREDWSYKFDLGVGDDRRFLNMVRMTVVDIDETKTVVLFTDAHTFESDLCAVRLAFQSSQSQSQSQSHIAVTTFRYLRHCARYSKDKVLLHLNGKTGLFDNKDIWDLESCETPERDMIPLSGNMDIMTCSPTSRRSDSILPKDAIVCSATVDGAVFEPRDDSSLPYVVTSHIGFEYIWDLAVLPSGYIVILDTEMRVSIWNSMISHCVRILTLGFKITTPATVGIDSHGRIYVPSNPLNRVFVFNEFDEQLFHFDVPAPVAVNVDTQDRVYVLESLRTQTVLHRFVF